MARQPKRALTVDETFSYRLRDARMSKLWTQEDLAVAMKRIGHPIARSGIAKIEAGARGVGGEHGTDPIKRGQTRPRGVSLTEAIAFAAALDVAPSSLYLPVIEDDDVQLAPALPPVDVATAHAWTRGERPLDPANERFYNYQTYGWRPPTPQRPTLEDLERLGIPVVFQESKKESE
jgi:transcriptional regulator with XRE-family HTH domain